MFLDNSHQKSLSAAANSSEASPRTVRPLASVPIDRSARPKGRDQQAVEKILLPLDSRFRGNDDWEKRPVSSHSREGGNPGRGTLRPFSTGC